MSRGDKKVRKKEAIMKDEDEFMQAIGEAAMKDSKKLFRIVTVPTVEDNSNIGFEGLQELADSFHRIARDYVNEKDPEGEKAALTDANLCEQLLDKWNGKNTRDVDVETIVAEATGLMASLFHNRVFMAAQAGDETGMYIDFRLGPPIDEVLAEIKGGNSDGDDDDCPCPACSAERARHESGIPADQLN